MPRKRRWDVAGAITPAGEGAGRRAPAVSGPSAERLRDGFESLGLTPYEARVLLALLRTGAATTMQLAELADVPRSSTYQILEGLSAKRLAGRVPTDGAARWACPSRDELFRRLDAAQEERLEQYRVRSAELKVLVEESLPDAPSVSLPYVHVLHGAGEAARAYDRLLAEAEQEILMFTRPPYAVPTGRPRSPVLDMLGRGIKTRVLYHAPDVDDPRHDAWRQEMATYHAAGVEARVLDYLPMKLVIVDKRLCLLAMPDLALEEDGFPTVLLVENGAFAEVQVAGFEHLWSQGRPYESIPEAESA